MAKKEREREFHVSDVLSIITGRVVSTRHTDGVYDILNFMTGDNLFAHQFPRANDECKPWLLRWFPELAEAGTPNNLARLDELISNAKYRNEPTENGVAMWLKWMTEQGACNLKEKYKVQQIPQEVHQHKNPIEEVAEMIGQKKI